jgi:hypothetical protein
MFGMTLTPSSVSGKQTPSSVSGKQTPADAITDRKGKLDALTQKLNKAQGDVTSAQMAQSSGSSKITDTYKAAMKKASDDQTAAQKAIAESFNAAQKAANDASTAEKTKLQKGVDDANATLAALMKDQKALMDEINNLIRQQMSQPRGGSRRYPKKRRARGASRR